MPHYTCDRCQTTFQSTQHPRYLVQLEVHRGGPLTDDGAGNSDVDPLSQLHQLLTGIESREVSDDDRDAFDELPPESFSGDSLPLINFHSAGDDLGDDELADAGLPSHRAQYDLCPRCYRAFVRDPWGHGRQVPATVSEE